MQKLDKVICMGKVVDKNLIMPVHNQEVLCKPKGGLWTSPHWEDGKFLSDWHEWCEGESFLDYTNMPCSILKLKQDIKIYTIDSHEDAIALLNDYKYKTKFAMPLFGNQKHIDYEKMSKDFDAIYLTNKGELDTRWRMRENEISLYGWDVATVLIFNPDCIESIEVFTYEKHEGEVADERNEQ